MRVFKVGNRLVVRLPAKVVRQLGLEAGAVVKVESAGSRVAVSRDLGGRQVLAKLRKYRGRLPSCFDRDEIHGRGPPRRPRVPGLLEGKIRIAEDFDAPLELTSATVMSPSHRRG